MRIVLVILAFAIILAGCGSTTTQTVTTTVTTTATQAAVTRILSTSHSVSTSTTVTPGGSPAARFGGQDLTNYQTEEAICASASLGEFARQDGVRTSLGVEYARRAIAQKEADGYRAGFQDAAYAGCMAGLQAR